MFKEVLMIPLVGATFHCHVVTTFFQRHLYALGTSKGTNLIKKKKEFQLKVQNVHYLRVTHNIICKKSDFTFVMNTSKKTKNYISQG